MVRVDGCGWAVVVRCWKIFLDFCVGRQQSVWLALEEVKDDRTRILDCLLKGSTLVSLTHLVFLLSLWNLLVPCGRFACSPPAFTAGRFFTVFRGVFLRKPSLLVFAVLPLALQH